MATIIDQLIVKLGIDSKDFKQGEKEVSASLDKTKKKAKETGKDIASSGKQGSEFFAVMQRSALRFFAVLAAGRGIYLGVTNTIKQGADFARLSKNLQTSADSLYRWQQAVKQNGGTAEGFTATINGLSSGLTELLQGGNENLRGFLGILGVGLNDASGKAKSLEELLLDISSAVEAGKFGPNRMNQVNLLKQMGLDEGTINLLLKGRKAVESALAAQSGYRESDARKALETEQKWLETQEKLSAVMRDLAYTIVPAITPVLDRLANIFEEMKPVLAAAASFIEKNKGFAEKSEKWNPLRWDSKFNILNRFIGKNEETPAGGMPPTSGGQKNPSRFSSGKIGPAPMSGAGTTGDLFAKIESKYGLPEGTLSSVYTIESTRGKNLISPKGATGPFQFMPKTAERFGLSREDTFDTAKAAEAAGKYIQALLKMFDGDMQKAISAYNWGEGNVMRKGLENAPAETRNYWRKFMELTPQATQKMNGANVSTTIGNVNVYTQATDAKGIARDIREQLVMQSNSGMR